MSGTQKGPLRAACRVRRNGTGHLATSVGAPERLLPHSSRPPVPPRMDRSPEIPVSGLGQSDQAAGGEHVQAPTRHAAAFQIVVPPQEDLCRCRLLRRSGLLVEDLIELRRPPRTRLAVVGAAAPHPRCRAASPRWGEAERPTGTQHPDAAGCNGTVSPRGGLPAHAPEALTQQAATVQSHGEADSPYRLAPAGRGRAAARVRGGADGRSEPGAGRRCRPRAGCGAGASCRRDRVGP